MTPLDTARIRADFPVLATPVRGRLPAYLDSACTTLRPEPVTRAIAERARAGAGCPGRAYHRLGREATATQEEAREAVRAFLDAGHAEEVVFVRGATEALNLVASGLPLRPGDTVLVTGIEHNSNLLPWQRLARRGAARLRVHRIDVATGFDPAAFARDLDPSVRVVAIPHVSNLCGIELPVADVCEAAHRVGAVVVVDGAQAVGTRPVSVRALGADFYALSFHKMMGPGGIGALYGRADLLDRLEPLLLGGNTVDDATYEAPTLAPVPARLEAGVPAADLLAGVRAAIGWVGALDPAAVRAHLLDLNRAATGALLALPRVSLIGPPDPAARGGIVNFHVRGVPSRDLALLLDDREAVMVRHGKQCVHSWYRAEGVPDSVRASFAVYNTLEEVERLVRVVRSVASMIG